MDRYNRQSFLGENVQDIISSSKVAILGLGGGGSHIVQQLVHIGFKNYLILDPDRVEESNLNRLIGATLEDVKQATLKVEIAKRIINGLHNDASIEAFPQRWQDHLNELKECSLVFGCIDSFIQRRDLECYLRSFQIPYIDIGMDVHCIPGNPPRVAGQVILSLPGCLCMQCMGYLTEDVLAREVARYGDAGSHPQVVWCNGVLASTAVGVAIDVLTNWTSFKKEPMYLSYDGNKNIIAPDSRLQYIKHRICPHYPMTKLINE
jgi:hypothetical protein